MGLIPEKDFVIQYIISSLASRRRSLLPSVKYVDDLKKRCQDPLNVFSESRNGDSDQPELPPSSYMAPVAR